MVRVATKDAFGYGRVSTPGQAGERHVSLPTQQARIEEFCEANGRAKKAEIATDVCNHTFRGSGITAYLSNDASKLEFAQVMAGHADPKTTKIYDRRSDEISLDEVEKIVSLL